MLVMAAIGWICCVGGKGRLVACERVTFRDVIMKFTDVFGTVGFDLSYTGPSL